jgi:predicted TIM-barrel fold metal-dependent hydrolase
LFSCFPAPLILYANTLLKDRLLFSSDYPLIKPDRWLALFKVAGFRAEANLLIL